jgi:hypothetical protein
MITIAEGNRWKMVFRTSYGLFESLVMPFRLTNALEFFLEFHNETHQPFIKIFAWPFE